VSTAIGLKRSDFSFCLQSVVCGPVVLKQLFMSDIVIQVDSLWKKYRLGVLGTGTLRRSGLK
jgi:hypothetical protein